MGLRRGRFAVIVVLVAAATVGAADLLRAPGAPGDRLEKAKAQDLLDPDAPIATARYREPTAVALAEAGLAPPPLQMAAAEPPVIRLDQAAPTPDPVAYQMARMAPRARIKIQTGLAAQTGSAFQAPDPDALAAFARADGRPVTAVQDITGRRSIGDEAKALLVKIAPSAEDSRRGRWFLFAASSGQAFGLNLIRDSEAGLRKAGWSVERLAVLGKGQIGAGWRRGDLQLSLAAAHREIGDLGIKVDDFVGGFTLSLRPSVPAAPQRPKAAERS